MGISVAHPKSDYSSTVSRSNCKNCFGDLPLEKENQDTY